MTSQEMNIIKKARADYQREWRKKNPEKVKAAQDRYWLRKAQSEEVEKHVTKKNQS